MSKRKIRSVDASRPPANGKNIKAEVFEAIPNKCPGCGYRNDRTESLVCSNCQNIIDAETQKAPQHVVELQGFWPKETLKELTVVEPKSPETHTVVGNVRYTYRDGFLVRKEII